ncbi:Regulator of Ty1 transposition protein 10 [Colletotrichum chlorophyti]|uniref:Regulator of Ty1 transposition protein 10 n=1 Tax=Colletotrichum chlorophyti TaxID=708187 RepID=A0A1Q8RJG8_9PEZI|nr:Regulator of Ty1 transposition protein 10 [Colletotrichum chlorophyti]
MDHKHARPVAGPLRRDRYLTPVTSLSFFNARDRETYLLAGEDTQLKVYDAESRLRFQLTIFRAQPIHGISVGGGEQAAEEDNHHVLVWGNQAVTVFPASVIEELLHRGDGAEADVSPPGRGMVETKAPDWIYDGAISSEDPSRGVLITAHNEALEFFISEDGWSLEFGSIVSPSRPILYSASLTWLSKTSMLVAAGTVFGEIILWKCHFADADAAQGGKKPWCEVLFVFTGHEGSIFGVDISPEIDLGQGEKARLLASCSDDRTVRIWDITERPEAPRLQYDSFGEARETGFGGEIANAAAAAPAATDFATTQVASSAPLVMVMGHISRIWHVRFPRTLDVLAQGSPATVYSFGEDSTLQTWSLEVDMVQWRQKCLTAPGANDVSVDARMTHKETFARHDGKHIWATALLQKADGEVLIATGGADSKINLLSDRSRAGSQIQGLPSELRTLVMRDVVAKLAPRDGNFASPLGTKEAFHRFAFVTKDTLLATSTTGRLLVGSFGAELTWAEIGTDGEMLAAIKACTTLKSPAPGMALLGTASKKILLYRNSTIQQVGTVPCKVADVFCLSPSDSDSPTEPDPPFKLEFLVTVLGGQEAMQILTLDLSTNTITSMIPVPELDSRFIVTAACPVNDLLILGSRHGYMAVFRRANGSLIPLAAPDRRTTDAITSISPFPTSSSPATHIITTSRDGNYRIYELSSSGVNLRHETAPAAVPNLEDAWLADRDLILCGFRSKNFIVWNETRHEEILRVDCGGAHRVFAYTPRSDGTGLRFVFNKAATLGVYVHGGATTRHRTLKPGSHGREVRAVAYSGGRYIATGAEDTAIRIWDRELRCVKVVKVHTAGLQAVKWLGEELLFSCGGNEEFMVWRTADLGRAGLGIVREAVFTDKSADGDLRITSFDVEDLGSGVVGVTMAFSNSVVKTYRYGPGTGFELMFQGRYTGACLTQARHLRIREGVFEVLTAATDGCLGVWRSERGEYVLKHTVRIHQSSIKALDVHVIGGRVVVLTGGDDDALGISTLDAENDFEVIGRAGVRKAHGAAINGLAVLPRAGEEVVFVTVSNDQRVKLWRVRWRGGVEEVTLLADRYSGVADAGDVEVVGDERFIVGGVGLDVWNWKGGI